MVRRLLIVCLILFICQINNAQTKRALVIGLGEQLDTNWAKINGDKDIPIVTELLLNSGFSKRNIITLVNEHANKKGIITAFGNLTKQCNKGDIVYVHFSGHGQRVTDVDGDDNDGWDESWIPYDAYRDYCIRDRGEKHLIDDEVYTILVDIKRKIGSTGKIMVVVDACHSGGSSFGLNNFSYSYDIQKYKTDVSIRGVFTPFVIPYKAVSKTIKVPEQWITLSACKSNQVNQEMNSPHVGILSYALYSIAKKGNIKFEEIEAFIERNKGPYPQTPILTGEVDKYNISDVLK